MASNEVQSHDSRTDNQKWIYIWRGANLIMSIFFLLSAFVQLNDPDPFIWVPIYIIPALLSGLIAVTHTISGNTLWRLACIIHLSVCLCGAAYLLSVIIEMLSGKFVNPLVHEEGRELGGLLIIIAWLAVCRFSSFCEDEKEARTGHGLLLLTGILGILPIAIWGLCFVEGLQSQLGHCKDMFPGMLGKHSDSY